MVRLTHSWWSVPMLDKRWNVEDQIEKSMYINALSVAYAKSSGAYITCHCDSYMYEYLKELPYDEIFVDLDDLKDKIKCDSTFMWAAGKFVALENEPIGTIHIDFDVFIKSPKCLENMCFDGADFIFSHIENANYHEQHSLRDVLTGINMEPNFACNVGIIGFNNENAKRDYINNYNSYLYSIDYKVGNDKDINADLILEQLYLYNMLNEYTGRTLVGDQRCDQTISMQKRSIDIGFEHLLGRSKYSPYLMNKTKNTLKTLFPDIYAKVENMNFNK